MPKKLWEIIWKGAFIKKLYSGNIRARENKNLNYNEIQNLQPTSKISSGLFAHHIYIFNYPCSLPFPNIFPNFILKLVNSCIVTYEVVKGILITMIIAF